MRRIAILVLTAAVLLGCTACSPEVSRDVWAMDTYMNLRLWGSEAETAAGQVEALLLQLEQDWSATGENSLLSRMNRGENVELTQQQTDFLAQLEQWSRSTQGAYDPKLGGATALWREGQVPPEAELAALSPQWDLGGAVKGYAGEQAVALLQQLDVDCAVLNLGGNVQTYGQKSDGTPWQVALENPDGGAYLGVLSLVGTQAAVTSGDYQRYFEENGVRYHHILDPQTLYPADSGLRSVTVLCSSGLAADVLSTALFVMGLETGTRYWRDKGGFEAVFVLTDGRIYATEGAALGGCEFEVICREN